MTNNTDPVRALIGQWRDAAEFFRGDAGSDIRETLRACARELEASLASAPPSAPEPEVHSYDPTEQRQSVTIRWPDGKCLGYVLDRTRYTDNLPPSAPVGVEDGPIDASDNAEYIEHCADRLERCGLRVTAGALRVIAHEHRTLVQQSAGVDRDEVRRVAQHIGTAVAYIDKAYPDAKMLDRDSTLRALRRWHERLTAALAAQQQGGA